MSTKTRFENEAEGNLEVACSGACTNHKLDNNDKKMQMFL